MAAGGVVGKRARCTAGIRDGHCGRYVLREEVFSGCCWQLPGYFSSNLIRRVACHFVYQRSLRCSFACRYQFLNKVAYLGFPGEGGLDGDRVSRRQK